MARCGGFLLVIVQDIPILPTYVGFGCFRPEISPYLYQMGRYSAGVEGNRLELDRALASPLASNELGDRQQIEYYLIWQVITVLRAQHWFLAVLQRRGRVGGALLALYRFPSPARSPASQHNIPHLANEYSVAPRSRPSRYPLRPARFVQGTDCWL
ncbi:hypothetical protein F5X98DRAFT_256419 [Xylaria grammica]|nr:hypothetical protein F5X98DRAFT_256419 [Xylaria grammica]